MLGFFGNDFIVYFCLKSSYKKLQKSSIYIDISLSADGSREHFHFKLLQSKTVSEIVH